MVNNFTKDLNTVLISSHYPHLTNKLFNNITLPYGLMISKPQNNNCKILNICNSKECIPENIYDELFSLVEIKKETKPKKSNVKSTRKKNKRKREKKTRKK